MKENDLCEYAMPGKEYDLTYPFEYKCCVMYECIKHEPTKDGNCIRKRIAEAQIGRCGYVRMNKKCQMWFEKNQ